MMEDSGIRVLLSTASGKDEAERIAEDLVGSGIAACCNIIPGVLSIYVWDERVNKDNEVLMLIKVPAEKVGKATDRIKALHSYDLPEIIALPVVGGSEDYIDWVKGIGEGKE